MEQALSISLAPYLILLFLVLNEQNTSRREVVKTTFTLPTLLIRSIERLPVNNPQSRKILKAACIFYFNHCKDELAFEEYRSLPTTYLRQCLGSNYKVTIWHMEENNILQCDGIYRSGQAFSYRLNPKLINDEFEQVTIETKSPQPRQNPLLVKVDSLISQLEVDEVAAMETINQYVVGLKIEDFTINEAIQQGFFHNLRFFGNSKPYQMTKEKALEKALEKGLVLLQDGRRYFITDTDRYVQEKKKRIEVHYKSALYRLMHPSEQKANRNDTNNRLDTLLTNLPGILIPHVRYRGERLVSIDLANSQYVLLAALLRKSGYDSEDLQRFEELCGEGKLYEYLQEQLNLKSRKEAKQLMFVITFSSPKFSGGNKKQFFKLFHSIKGFINDFYKKQKGKEGLKESKFAVMLQRLESSIFIDTIYSRMLDEGLAAFSKHDEILVVESQAGRAKQIMREELDRYRLRYTLKVDK